MELFKEILSLVGFYEYLQPALTIFITTMGMVYVFGRMLGIAKTWVGKNRIAVISGLVLSAGYSFSPVRQVIPSEVMEFMFMVGLIYVLYTLIGMRMASRLGKFQDKKLADGGFDEGIPEVTKAGKKK